MYALAVSMKHISIIITLMFAKMFFVTCIRQTTNSLHQINRIRSPYFFPLVHLKRIRIKFNQDDVKHYVVSSIAQHFVLFLENSKFSVMKIFTCDIKYKKYMTIFAVYIRYN